MAIRRSVSEVVTGLPSASSWMPASSARTPGAFTNADELDRPRGWDVVIDCTGVVAAIEDAIPRVGKGGTFLQFGVTHQGAGVKVDPYRIYNEEITITGSMAVLHSFERAGELFAGGILDPDIFISHRLPLAEYEDALGLLANGVGRKIQVVPGLEAAVTRLAVSPLPPAGPSRARSARTRSPCKAASDLNSVER